MEAIRELDNLLNVPDLALAAIAALINVHKMSDVKGRSSQASALALCAPPKLYSRVRGAEVLSFFCCPSLCNFVVVCHGVMGWTRSCIDKDAVTKLTTRLTQLSKTVRIILILACVCVCGGGMGE